MPDRRCNLGFKHRGDFGAACIAKIIHFIPCARLPQAPISAAQTIAAGNDMATQTEKATQGAAETTLTLEPPAPLQNVQAEQAAGLVPLKDEQKSRSRRRSTPSSTSSSRSIPTRPNSARRSISSPRWAARRSPRPPAPPTASSTARSRRSTRIAASAPNLTQLRRTVEDLDPGRGVKPQEIVRHHPLGRRPARLFPRNISRRRPTSPPSSPPSPRARTSC